MRIAFTGGGTGGHLFPIIAIAREIRNLSRGKTLPEFYYVGPVNQLGAVALSQENIHISPVLAGKIRRYWTPLSTPQNLFDLLFKMPVGIIQAFAHIFFIAPDLIISKGGYGSIPGVIAGWILQVPIFLHESDVAPGLANRFLSKFAIEIFVSFPIRETEFFPTRKMISTGNPVRRELLDGSAETAKEIFSLSGQKAVMLVLGGSQGSQRINEMLLQAMPDIFLDFELIHQTGVQNFEQVKAEANVVIPEKLKKYYHPCAFLAENDLRHALQAASLIVSRAGSGSIFEIAAVVKPSILIPLPEAAQDHQLKNAYAYGRTNAATVIEEQNLKPHFFLERAKHIVSSPSILSEMTAAAKEFSRIQAAKIIAEYVLAYLE